MSSINIICICVGFCAGASTVALAVWLIHESTMKLMRAISEIDVSDYEAIMKEQQS